MNELNVRSDAVDVEQIMRQIRARIREKRGADYTEAELQQLANVKLEKFLDARGVRSDLVEQFRKHRIVSREPPTYEFEDTTLYDTHRGLLRTIRRLLHPILKLFINPNPLVHALHTQKQINAEYHRRFREREELDPLWYEVIHNLVLEVTRAGIDVHNLKMRVESLSSRLDFDERRARSLESTVQYRPPARPAAAAIPNGPPPSPETVGSGPATPRPDAPAAQPSAGSEATGAGGERRRRRRRRRRRPGQTMAENQAGNGDRTQAGDGSSRQDEGSAANGYEGNDEPDGPDEDGNDPGGSDPGATDQ